MQNTTLDRARLDAGLRNTTVTQPFTHVIYVHGWMDGWIDGWIDAVATEF
jgi:hypothetical protein